MPAVPDIRADELVRSGAPADDVDDAEVFEAEQLEPLIPRWAMWFYLLSPPIIALVLHPELMEVDKAAMTRSLLGTWIHTVAIGASLHGFYTWVVPRVIAPVERPLVRVIIHAAFIVLGTASGLAVSAPVAYVLSGWGPRRPWWELYTSLVIASLFVVAMVSYQKLRQRARQVERRAHRAQQAALKARLASLMSRTNPHFLFNSLNTVAGLIGENPRRAEEAVERLADLFRYTLDASRRPRVALRDEVQAAKTYLGMEELRYEDRLQYEVTLEEAAAGLRVPPLIIQPLVENAIRHGIEQRGRGRVEVKATSRDGRLIIVVSDDGPGPGRSQQVGSGTSLADLRQRLELLYGERASLEVGEGEGGGCVATLSLPGGT